MLAVLGVIVSMFYFIQGYLHQNQVDAVEAQTRQQQLQYEVVAQNFPNTPIPGSDLKAAVDIAHIIQKNNQTPQYFMQVLSAAFEVSPKIAINRMRWVQNNQADIEDEALNKTLKNSANNTTVADPTTLLQIAFINAEIRDFNGDYHAALESVSRLATRLRANAEVQQVLVLQEPVNVSSFASLQGSTTDESEITKRTPAIFKLKVVLNPLDKEVVQ